MSKYGSSTQISFISGFNLQILWRYLPSTKISTVALLQILKRGWSCYRAILIALVGCCAAALLALPVQADPVPSKKIEVALSDAQSQFFKALVRKDVAVLRNMMAEEMIYTHSTAVAQNREEFISDIISGAMEYRSIDVVEQKIRSYGNVGVIIGTVKFGVFKGDADRSFEVRFTDAYINRNGRWQLIAWQSTRVGPPPPGSPSK